MIAYITGASSGLGAYTAQALADAGWTVVAGARPFTGETDGRMTPPPPDVTRDDSVRGFMERAKQIGAPDAVIHCAAVLCFGSCEETALADYARVMETNFLGMVRVNQQVLPLMREKGGGKVVLFSSINGLMGLPFQSAYTASKHAIEGYAECLAQEVTPFGIQVMLLEPGDHRRGSSRRRFTSAALPDASPYWADFRKGTEAIRRDEELDNLHSIYVDQWDWETVITADQHTLDFLQDPVRDTVDAVCATSDELRWMFPALKTIHLGRDVTFITTQELEDMYPDYTPKQRENVFAKEHGTICIMKIGGKLKSGKSHDGRAPDYDDWALNCDILFWHVPLGCALELSSMGIRVNAESLRRQLEEAGCPQRAELPFHKMLLDGALPLTMGGGIGQSRLCMLLLGKAHVGEVQVSLWDDDTVAACEKAGIALL